jgi:hypothetical protein
MPPDPARLLEKPNWFVEEILIFYKAFGFTIEREILGYVVIYHPQHSHLRLTLPLENVELPLSCVLRAKQHFDFLTDLIGRDQTDE